jgi:hypothetical protein
MKAKILGILLVMMVAVSACGQNSPQGTLVFKNYSSNNTNQMFAEYVIQTIGSNSKQSIFGTYSQMSDYSYPIRLENVNGTLYDVSIDQLESDKNPTIHVSVYDKSFGNKVFDFSDEDFPEDVDIYGQSIVSNSNNELFLMVYCRPKDDQNSFFIIYKVLLNEQKLVKISRIDLPRNYYIHSVDSQRALIFNVDRTVENNWWWIGTLSFATPEGIRELPTQDRSLGEPTLSPDGKRIFYINETLDDINYTVCLKSIPVASTENDPAVLDCWSKPLIEVFRTWAPNNPDIPQIEISFSPNEKYLAVSFWDNTLPSTISIYNITDQDNPERIDGIATDNVSHMATWSPNSRWLAYYDNADGNQPGYYTLKVGTGQRDILMQDPSWTMEADFNSIYRVHTPLILEFWLP